MKTLTEYELRAMCLPAGTEEYTVEAGVFVTPMAAEYLRDRGIHLVVRQQSAMDMMPQTPLGTGSSKYRLASGGTVGEKPEAMTHLHGNVLVPKSHPRIALRGKLDSLEAQIIEAQVTAEQEGFPTAALDLQELLLLARRILGAEVKETPLGKFELLGMDSDRLRYVSHHVTEELGINHPVPHYSMGKLCAVLNSLRTAVRETELAAVAAFSGEEIHGDLIEALNRMSSCVYIIFCRKLSGFYSCEKRENEHG